jgi:DNA-binding transcriptional ArsR family regulator
VPPADPHPAGELSGLRVLAHPLRLRMLSLLTGAPFSASELSRELGVSQALASYHLRQLHAAGLIELSEVRAKRGGRERRFVYTGASSAARNDPPPDPAHPAPADPADATDGHELLAEALCVELRRRSHEAQPGGRRLGVDAELWIAPEEWERALDGISAAARALHDCAQPPRTPGTVRASVSALLFAMRDAQA